MVYSQVVDAKVGFVGLRLQVIIGLHAYVTSLFIQIEQGGELRTFQGQFGVERQTVRYHQCRLRSRTA